MIDISIKTEMTNDEIDYINEQLFQFNLKSAPTNKDAVIKDVHLALKDENEKIYGALLGKIYRFCMIIETLWICEEQRGLGYGEKLLMKAEKIALLNRCNFIHLDTYSFQAPEFYKKYGYVVFGVLDGYVDGIKRYYLKKDI